MVAALEIDTNLDFVCQYFSSCHTPSSTGRSVRSLLCSPALFMDAGVLFLTTLTVYLKPSLFMYVSSSFLTNVKFQPDMCRR